MARLPGGAGRGGAAVLKALVEPSSLEGTPPPRRRPPRLQPLYRTTVTVNEINVTYSYSEDVSAAVAEVTTARLYTPPAIGLIKSLQPQSFGVARRLRAVAGRGAAGRSWAGAADHSGGAARAPTGRPSWPV